MCVCLFNSIFYIVAIVAGWILVQSVCSFVKPSWRIIPRFDTYFTLRIGCAIVMTASLVLYFTGYLNGCIDGPKEFVSVASRSIISTSRLFLAQSDLGSVNVSCRECREFVQAFSITYFTAVLLTSLLIIRLIGFRLRAWLHLFWYSLGRHNKVLNIFWGINDSSAALAKNIMDTHREDNTVIFVRTGNTGKEQPFSKTVDIDYILNTRAIRSYEIEELTAREYMFTVCNGDLANMEVDSPSRIFRRLHLRRLGRIVSRAARVRVFFLSDNEGANIKCALNMLKERSLLGARRVEIYVHARKCAQNELIDHYNSYHSIPNFNVKIIDSSYLAVTSLKMTPEYHPVNFVDVDSRTALVRSRYSAMVIGFGETGQEAFDFMYEFGAFAGEGGGKSPTHYCAIDNSMDSIAGLFYAKRPALREKPNVELCRADIDSQQFWDKTAELLPDLNQVVIAIGDDKSGSTLAVNIYRLACRIRNNNLHNFMIFVRCHQAENYKLMREMADVCNLNNSESGGRIVIFGYPGELYTYGMIIDDTILGEAKEYNKTYKEVLNHTQYEDAGAAWQESFGPEAIAKRRDKYNSEFFAIREMHREISQNISNSLHTYTKIKLLNINSEEELAKLYGIARSRTRETIRYDAADPETREKLKNLAVCEHIRWEASHELRGFLPGAKNEILKNHDCMCAWDDLKDDLTRSYDCNVVDTSIKLLYDKLHERK